MNSQSRFSASSQRDSVLKNSQAGVSPFEDGGEIPPGKRNGSKSRMSSLSRRNFARAKAQVMSIIGEMVRPKNSGDTNGMMANGGWIKSAVNPDHKGYCTPMTKATCTPRRKAFAMTMKKHHGFHKKEFGGAFEDFGPGDGKPTVLDPRSRRAEIDRRLALTYPGRSLEELDSHNVPSMPGVADTPTVTALRRGFPPSIRVESMGPLSGKSPYQPTMEDLMATDYNNKLFMTAKAANSGRRKGGKMSRFSKAYC